MKSSILLMYLVTGMGMLTFAQNSINKSIDADLAAGHQKWLDGRAAAFSRDPWRQFGNKIVRTSSSWATFFGDVTQVTTNGVFINGTYRGFDGTPGFQGRFLVANFPYPTAVGDKIPVESFYLALPSGVFNYTSVGAGLQTIHKLDYGTVYLPPPPTPEQVEAAKKAAAESKAKSDVAKSAAAVRALAANQAAADAGDAYGLLRMGERYRDGDGVEKDLNKARVFLQKASDAGSPTAADDLKKLATDSPAPDTSR